MKKEIPYKIYLSEKELPKKWLNIRAFMDKKPAPLLNPDTQKPVTQDELSKMFCDELARQPCVPFENEARRSSFSFCS